MMTSASPTRSRAVCQPLDPRAMIAANSTSRSRLAAYRMSPTPAVRMTTMKAISIAMNPYNAREKGFEVCCSISSSTISTDETAPTPRSPAFTLRQSASGRRSTRYRNVPGPNTDDANPSKGRRVSRLP